MTTLSEANAKFAAYFYHLLRKEHPCGNLLFSPVNLTTGLALILYGSRCDTPPKIEKILHWDELKGCETPGRTRYLKPTRSYGHLGDKLRSHFSYRISPTLGLHSWDVKQGLRSGAAPRGSPTECRPQPEPPCCPPQEVPDYECEKPEGVHSEFHKILVELNKPTTDYQLSIANHLYADYSIVFIQKFLYCALKLYLTEVDGADIHNAPEEVRRLINLWVEVHTHGKIKDLLPKDSFDCLAQLLLVNALYFKGQWDVKFDKELTQEGTFYSIEGDCSTVQLMYRKGLYNIGTIARNGAQVLEIPYRNHEMSLFILLPKDCNPDSFHQLEDELTHEELLGMSCILKPEEVEMFIPKFSIEKSIEAITYLDLPNLTDPKQADLSGATTTKVVALTQLVHDTFIEVDEEGCEETEAPACPRGKHQAHWEAIEFAADHAFLFYVLHKCTQSIIVIGRFTKPE